MSWYFKGKATGKTSVSVQHMNAIVESASIAVRHMRTDYLQDTKDAIHEFQEKKLV